MTTATAESMFVPQSWDDLALCLSKTQIDDLRHLRYGRETIATLFWGEFGLGKTAASRFIARCATCRRATTPLGDPCGVCAACSVEWTSRRLYDNSVLEIDCPRHAPKDISERIDAARQYCSCFPLTDLHGIVVILDEVHRNDRLLSEKLLKILEEPRDDLFLLASARPEMLDEALVQRCIDIELTAPDADRCVAWLSRLLARAGVAASSAQIEEIVDSCERVPRRIRNLVRRRLRVADDGTSTLR